MEMVGCRDVDRVKPFSKQRGKLAVSARAEPPCGVARAGIGVAYRDDAIARGNDPRRHEVARDPTEAHDAPAQHHQRSGRSTSSRERALLAVAGT